MKKHLLFYLFCILNSAFLTLNSEFLSAQNLVTNSSFEQYDTCPNYLSQIERAIGWYNFGISPDYFNACSFSPDVSVPSNSFGFQLPASGNAYSGIGCYEDTIYKEPFGVREFIGTQLTESLIIGKKYYISFKVSPAYNPTPPWDPVVCFVNNIGVKLSTIPYNSSSSLILTNNFAHIFYPNIISDTTNWFTIFGSVVADSSYQYIILGNFFNDSAITILCDSTSSFFPWSYYYIDDVCLSNDSSVCDTETGINNNYIYHDLISIYPNPANEFLNIDIDNNCNKEIVRIYDIYGKLIVSQELKELNNVLNVSNFPKGIYIIKLFTNNKIFTKKIIINH